MKTIDIKVKKRTDLGKKATKALRAAEQVPCVMYGNGKENLHFYAHINDFRHIIYTPETFLINLDVEGEKYQVVTQDMQFHPVTDNVIHIDFLQVDADKPVKVELPVNPVGAPEGVVVGGGVLVQISRRLRVKGLVSNIPESLDVEVTQLKLGQSIKVSELDFEGIELISPKDAVVCAVQVTRLAKSLAVGEGEEGEEAEEEAAE